MPECVVATSPFFDEGNQLFYEASFDKENHKLSLNIFNHRGVLKNRRSMKIQTQISYLFTAQQYLIGLDENHKTIIIVDITKHTKSIVTGQITNEHGVKQKIMKNNPKFNIFYYDRKMNLFFGVLDNHHVLFLKINRFDQVHDNKLLSESRNSAKQNMNIYIEKIYTSPQSITKLQIKHEVRMKRKIINSPKKNKSANYQPKSSISYFQNQNQKKKPLKSQQERVDLICLLIKEKKIMRTLEIDWNTNKPIEIIDHNKIHDFCFRNQWDLTLSYPQNQCKQKKLQGQVFYFYTKIKGQYKISVFLTSYKIFCSEQSIFIIDPQQGIIVGIYNRQFRKIQECYSIPKQINYSNTILMIEKPQQNYIRFLFSIFNSTRSQFQYYPVLALLHSAQPNIEELMYIKKNIQKIFTPNGLIHPYFEQKIVYFLQQIIKQDSLNNSQQNSNQMINVSDRSYIRKQDKYFIAKKFLDRFVLTSSNLSSRFLYSLTNYGVKVLFEDKLQQDLVIQQKKQVNKSDENKINEHKQQQLKNNQNGDKKIKIKRKQTRCNFDRWNEYFEQMIYQKYIILKQLILQNEAASFSRSNNKQYSEIINNKEPCNTNQINNYQQQEYQKQIITDMTRDLEKIKNKLSLISNFYNKMLQFVQNSSYKTNKIQNKQQNEQFRHKLNYYKSIMRQNLNKTHSLFIIFDLFSGFTPKAINFIVSYNDLQKAIQNVFQQFKIQRLNNIHYYKKQVNTYQNYNNLNLSYQQTSLHRNLLLHQYFNNARLFQIPGQQYNLTYLLQYLLSNLNNFQEIGYIYFMVQMELHRIIQPEQQNKSQINDSFIENLHFPYIGKYLTNFYIAVSNIEPLIHSLWSDEQMRQQTNKVQHGSRLALKLNIDSFTYYMIQVCSQYNLSLTLMKLVDSIKIQPYVPNEYYPSFNKNNKQVRSLQISRNFIQNEILIIKCIVNCGVGCNSKDYNNTIRQLLYFEMKRILSIVDLMNRNIKQSPLNINKQSRQQQQSNKNNENKKNNENMNMSKINMINKQNRNRIIIGQDIKVKNILLKEFVLVIMNNLNNPLRIIEQLKKQCLVLQEDRLFVQNLVEDKLKVGLRNLIRKTDYNNKQKTLQNKITQLNKVTM